MSTRQGWWRGQLVPASFFGSFYLCTDSSLKFCMPRQLSYETFLSTTNKSVSTSHVANVTHQLPAIHASIKQNHISVWSSCLTFQHGLLRRRHCTPPLSSPFSTLSSTLLSGHNRWSKIKHDKAKVDSDKSKTRSALMREITLASKLSSPSLPFLLNRAKSLNIPKTSISAAIARGQGLSPTGASLQPLTIEFVLPDLAPSSGSSTSGSAGVVGMVECMVENKARMRQDIFTLLKGFGGKEGVVGWMFGRKGKVEFGRGEAEPAPSTSTSNAASGGGGDGVADTSDVVSMSEDAILEAGIEANALDVHISTDTVIAYTEPQELSAVAENLEKAFGATRKSMELVWEAQEKAKIGEEGLETVERLVGKLEEEGGVVGVWVNVGLADR